MLNNQFTNRPLTYIDLFAGCGGLSLGLYNSGWKGLFAIEKSPDAFRTLQHNLIAEKKHFNWPPWLPQTNHDIKKVLKQFHSHLTAMKGKVDMVCGGPPCQGFSTAGKRDEKDKRNGLIKDYIKFIDLVRPKILFFENVKGFTLEFNRNKSKGKQYSLYVIKKLTELGYDVSGDMIDFSNFGIPQKRCRFILIGVRKEGQGKNKTTSEAFFEKITNNKEAFLINKGLKLNPTLEEAISDLLRTFGEIQSPDTKKFQAGLYAPIMSCYQKYFRRNLGETEVPDSHRFANHKMHIKERFAEILQLSKRNRSISNELKIKYKTRKRTIVPLNGNTASPTITTLPDDYIHYCEPRILTVREYARIQTFPDDFKIKGKYTTGGKLRVKEVPRYTQIGNAIPPLFGEQCGVALKTYFQ